MFVVRHAIVVSNPRNKQALDNSISVILVSTNDDTALDVFDDMDTKYSSHNSI